MGLTISGPEERKLERLASPSACGVIGDVIGVSAVQT